MARVALRGDCGCPPESSVLAVGVGLDDDKCIPEPETPVENTLPVMVLRERVRQGYTDDGNDVLVWRTIAEGATITKLVREEYDQDAGATKVKGILVMANTAGLTDVKETAVLFEGEILWRITAAKVLPDRMEFKIERLDGPQ